MAGLSSFYSPFAISESQKKEQGEMPCSENCVDPIFPQNFDLILAAG
jgi:hypothetical protein